jgi:hypothetical protein
MKMIFRLFFFIVLFSGLLNATESYSQKKSKSIRQIERRSKKSEGFLNAEKSRKVIKAEKKAEKVKKKQEEAYEKAKKKDKKHRLEIQSANTRQMMVDTEKKSEENRKAKREPFLKRLFKRKPR